MSDRGVVWSREAVGKVAGALDSLGAASTYPDVRVRAVEAATALRKDLARAEQAAFGPCETCLSVYLPLYLFTCRTCEVNPARKCATTGNHYKPASPPSAPEPEEVAAEAEGTLVSRELVAQAVSTLHETAKTLEAEGTSLCRLAASRRRLMADAIQCLAETDQTCPTCRHRETSEEYLPCCTCGPGFDRWQPNKADFDREEQPAPADPTASADPAPDICAECGDGLDGYSYGGEGEPLCIECATREVEVPAPKKACETCMGSWCAGRMSESGECDHWEGAPVELIKRTMQRISQAWQRRALLAEAALRDLHGPPVAAPPSAAPEGECPPGCCEHSDEECDFARANREAFRALAADRAKLERECAERRVDRRGLVEQFETQRERAQKAEARVAELEGKLAEAERKAEGCFRLTPGDADWLRAAAALLVMERERQQAPSAAEKWRIVADAIERGTGGEGVWVTRQQVRIMLEGCPPEFHDPLKMLLIVAGVPPEWLAPEARAEAPGEEAKR